MKKFILLSLISYISFTATRVSDNEVLGGIFTNKTAKEFVKDSFDYKKDLAVVSDRLNSEENALIDAKRGLSYSIELYGLDYLEKLHKETKLTGQSFDNDTLRYMVKEYAKEFVENNKYEIAKIGQSFEKYIILIKVEKEKVEKDLKNIYRERLMKVIERLNDIYHDLEK